MAIKFGTDGWRAIIAQTYTFDNLERVAFATAQWLHQTAGPTPSIVLGYDTRFLGREFAQHAAAVFASQGVSVLLASRFCTTPAISWAAKHYQRSAGIVITASHNPPAYNGFKIKGPFGGPASPEMIAEVEAVLATLPDALPAPAPFEALVADGQIQHEDIHAAYVHLLAEQLDIEAIRTARLKVVHDAMYGAGQGILVDLLGDQVYALHHDLNPGFNGQAPEPIERNLAELAATIVATGSDAGIANDGDADRIGMYDEKGQFVSSHYLLALLTKYLHETRGLSGSLIKTYSTTHLLDKMAKHYSLPIETTKIGFKYIGPKIVAGDVLVGGEESGGMAVKGHIPERDGIYIGLLILEMMVKRGKTLSALVQELFDTFGPHEHYRVDVHTTPEKMKACLKRLSGESGLTSIDGDAVQHLGTLDGYKHLLAEGWLLVRPSGTEPVLRIYSEAPTPEKAKAFVLDTVAQLGLSD